MHGDCPLLPNPASYLLASAGSPPKACVASIAVIAGVQCHPVCAPRLLVLPWLFCARVIRAGKGRCRGVKDT